MNDNGMQPPCVFSYACQLNLQGCLNHSMQATVIDRLYAQTALHEVVHHPVIMTCDACSICICIAAALLLHTAIASACSTYTNLT